MHHYLVVLQVARQLLLVIFLPILRLALKFTSTVPIFTFIVLNKIVKFSFIIDSLYEKTIWEIPTMAKVFYKLCLTYLTLLAEGRRGQ